MTFSHKLSTLNCTSLITDILTFKLKLNTDVIIIVKFAHFEPTHEIKTVMAFRNKIVKQELQI